MTTIDTSFGHWLLYCQEPPEDPFSPAGRLVDLLRGDIWAGKALPIKTLADLRLQAKRSAPGTGDKLVVPLWAAYCAWSGSIDDEDDCGLGAELLLDEGEPPPLRRSRR